MISCIIAYYDILWSNLIKFEGQFDMHLIPQQDL